MPENDIQQEVSAELRAQIAENKRRFEVDTDELRRLIGVYGIADILGMSAEILRDKIDDKWLEMSADSVNERAKDLAMAADILDAAQKGVDLPYGAYSSSRKNRQGAYVGMVNALQKMSY